VLLTSTVEAVLPLETTTSPNKPLHASHHGPYKTIQGTFSCTKLDHSNCTLLAVNPGTSSERERFPVVAYMIGGYSESSMFTKLFAMIASWGYVVLTPNSCQSPYACPSSHVTANPTCSTSDPTQWPFTAMECAVQTPPAVIPNCTQCVAGGPRRVRYDHSTGAIIRGFQDACCCSACFG